MTEVYYPVKWFINVLKVGKGKYNLGYCTYGKGIAFVNDDPLTPMVVMDVIAYNDYCSDSKWCFNIKCPLSKPDLNYLRKFGIRNEEELKCFHKKLVEIEKKLKEAGYSFEKMDCERILFTKPVIELKKKSELKEAH